jgi:hypothetical protein
MEQSLSSESNRLSPGKDIPHLLWKWKIYYGVKKWPSFSHPHSHVSNACYIPCPFNSP